MQMDTVNYELDEPLTNTIATPLDPPSERRHLAYLWVALAVWSLGALSTHWIGVWAGIGGAAVSLGIWGLIFDDRLTADLRRPNLKLTVIGLLAGVVMLLGTYLGYRTLMIWDTALHGATGELYRFFASLPRHLVPLAVPMIILSEEVVWRGRIQALFLERMPPVAAAVVTAALYALAHAAIGSWLLVAVAFACGLFWGTLRGATGSIVPPLIAHVIWDVCVMVLFPLTIPR